jgi:hypothetical protein
VQVEARIAQEPALDLRGLVGGVVNEQEVDAEVAWHHLSEPSTFPVTTPKAVDSDVVS